MKFLKHHNILIGPAQKNRISKHHHYHIGMPVLINKKTPRIDNKRLQIIKNEKKMLTPAYFHNIQRLYWLDAVLRNKKKNCMKYHQWKNFNLYYFFFVSIHPHSQTRLMKNISENLNFRSQRTITPKWWLKVPPNDVQVFLLSYFIWFCFWSSV